MKTTMSVSLLLVLVLATSACVFKGGDTEYVHPPTLGAELSDLHKAYERGAISKSDYDAKREELLARREARGN